MSFNEVIFIAFLSFSIKIKPIFLDLRYLQFTIYLYPTNSIMVELLIGKLNYWVYIALIMIGFYAMIIKRNLVKKLIGMNIFQTAIILFFISIAYKKNANIPIIDKLLGEDPINYMNPLPHVLMLTAIVVMVSTLGVALSLVILIYRQYKTLDEDEIIEKIEKHSD